MISILISIIGIGIAMKDVLDPRITEAATVLNERLSAGKVTLYYTDDSTLLFAIKRVLIPSRSTATMLVVDDDGPRWETKVVVITNVDDLSTIDWVIQGKKVDDYIGFVKLDEKWFVENKIDRLLFPENFSGAKP